MLVGLALVPLVPTLAPLPVLGAVAVSALARRRAQRAQVAAWAEALPPTVDLIALALGSGPHRAGRPRPRRLPGPTAPRPGAGRGGRAGPPRRGPAGALDRLAAAAPTLVPLVALLSAAVVDGTPVVAPLARLAEEQRQVRRRAAEVRARQVPVRLLFPLVLCTLPAFALLTVVPPVVVALDDLGR